MGSWSRGATEGGSLLATSADEVLAHLLREEGTVAAERLQALLDQADLSERPLDELLVEEGALTRPQRDRYVRTRSVLGRGCGACGEQTYLLPGQGARRHACEHCGGRLRAGTSRRIGAPVEAPPGWDEEGRRSRRLEARASRRHEPPPPLTGSPTSAPPVGSDELAPRTSRLAAGPSIEAPREAAGRTPVPPRPTLRRAAEALAPPPRLTQRAPAGAGEQGPRATQRRAAPSGARATNGGLPLEVARVVRAAFDETREELIERVRREARGEAARELERAGALTLAARLAVLEGAQVERSAPPAELVGRLEAQLAARVAEQVEARLVGLQGRLDQRLAERDAAIDERAGRQASGALLAAASGKGAAGRALLGAIEKELRQQASTLLDEEALEARLQEAVAEGVRRWAEAEGPGWLAEQPALQSLGEQEPGEGLRANLEALEASARGDAAQVEALARLAQGLQGRLDALEDVVRDPEPNPSQERRLRLLEEQLVDERRARTKEIAELNQTQLLAAAEAARSVVREETSRIDFGGVEERVREEGEVALGEVAAVVERLGRQLLAIERQLEARVRREAGVLRVRHALRRSLRVGGVVWGLLLIPCLLAYALYPVVYVAKVPLGPPAREPYAGDLERLRGAVLDPASLEEVAGEVGMPVEAGWAERLAGLPAARGERLDAGLEPFGSPPRALYVRVQGLGAAQATAAAEALAERVEAAGEGIAAPLARIRPAEAESVAHTGLWTALAALLLIAPVFGLAALRELRRVGFHDAAELGDLTDLPVLLSVAAEERDA